MKSFYRNIKLHKSGIGLLVLALTLGGISAKAAEDSRSNSSGYTFCIKSKSNDDVTYPGTANCPKGYTKLVLGQTGEDGATGPAGPAGPIGLTGPAGANGVDGATGSVGANGVDGATGSVGATGPIGPIGPAGANAPATQYAVGYVLVSRGGATPAVWASYSTSLGSPFDNTASGTFRFTCNATQAPCVVSLASQSTAAGVTVWPRVMIYKSDINTGQIFGQCEYGDGVSRNSPYGTVGTTPTPTALSINIGGSLDCGAGAAQTYVAPGDVSSIVVPAGYYDVQSNFTFKG